MGSAYDREEEQLDEDFRQGLITQQEYNKQLRTMRRDYEEEMREYAADRYERAEQEFMDRF